MKYILLLSALFAFGNTSSAQVTNSQVSWSNYELKAQDETDHMNEVLKLKPDEMDSVKAINRNYFYEIASLQTTKLSASERKDKLIKIENSRITRLKNNLTTAQYKQYFDKVTAVKLKWQHRQDSLRSKHH